MSGFIHAHLDQNSPGRMTTCEVRVKLVAVKMKHLLGWRTVYLRRKMFTTQLASQWTHQGMLQSNLEKARLRGARQNEPKAQRKVNLPSFRKRY